MKKMNFKSESGFTLMELMVVIGVLAILIAILLPQFTGYTAQAQAISAASEAKNALTAGYSYYVSVTSRDSSATAFSATTAKERMEKAANGDGTVTVTSPTVAQYQVTKGNLQFTAYMDLTTGKITAPAGGSGGSAGAAGEMTCSPVNNGSQDTCDDLKAEGALKIQ